MIPFINLGSLQIPTFFLVISVSLSLMLFLLSREVDRQQKSRKLAFDLALTLMIAGFVGGRLLHVFYEEWTYYSANPLQVLYFWNGGFVFLGGLLLCLIAGYIFTRIHKVNFLEWADFFTPLFSLGHALGRIGCFLSGCCYGSYCTLPWAIDGRHPTTLYLFFSELLIFFSLLGLRRYRFFQQTTGALFVLWLTVHSSVRFYTEYFRDDFRGIFIRLPLFGSLSISQLISLFIIFNGCVFLVRSLISFRRSSR
ncbi:prolipoprotein diacylglyceryl transferase [Pseudobdellovibrio exovorus]|uniref:Phosphatidylglycerol--prolipoprotein diacylglyceryl transferase n=1 Tax=Pseudobdellovibrio exovorus JSS TaxID=1184267 RepID=M4VSZ8_9BACT|nr:prolipoprotein diacylglyceryl transferase [Pseudobdellovibrio exovorus]AGH96334.1 putative prolipoprotein diacylglycerol transferase [Pseudobdellovibrio exovorus JSS]